jgi:hypothetical protein
MDRTLLQKITAAWQEVVSEKKKLDPVDPDELKGTHADRKDKDIDNDGDVDKSDEYLHNRRKAVKHAMKKEEKGVKENDDEETPPNKNGMAKCPHCNGSSDNHDEECPKYKASEMKKATQEDLDATSAQKALKHDCAKHVTSEQWGFGECIPGQHTLVEQEDGTAIVTHYDVMFEHGIEMDVPVEELKILVSESHLHGSKKWSKKNESVRSEEDLDEAEWKKEGPWKKVKPGERKDKYGNVVKDKNVPRNLARSAAKKTAAMSESIEKTVAVFSDEIEKTYIEKLAEQMRRYTSIWEKASVGSAGKPKETMMDKFKGGNSQQMAKDNNIDNPQHADVTPEEEGHDDATRAGRVTKPAPSRPGDNKAGDKKIINPVKGA